jgi:hypothetical protein
MQFEREAGVWFTRRKTTLKEKKSAPELFKLVEDAIVFEHFFLSH